MEQHYITRRQTLKSIVGSSFIFTPALSAMAKNTDRLFKIGACDWSLGHRGQVSAMKFASEIGLDGVQISFGEPGGDNDLRKEECRNQTIQAAKQQNIKISSLAMGILNQVPYSSNPDAEQWVSECIEVMSMMKQRVLLLAFFGKGDIKDKPELIREVILRLKKVAPKAERAGVVLGLETWLNADEHIRILDAVGSSAVQVYYDTANMNKRGYDIYQEIRQLGRHRICQIHCKENGFLLGKGRVDFLKVKEAIDAIGYQGWLVIESAISKDIGVRDSYIHNQEYLRSIFPTEISGK